MGVAACRSLHPNSLLQSFMEGRLRVSICALIFQLLRGTDHNLAAYDIKLLIDKDSVDIIRPQWVTDCIHRGELVPLRKK